METSSERRRRKLTALCAERGIESVAERAGLNRATLDQIIKGTKLPPKRDGTRSSRNLGDDAARKIEDGETLGRGWFDLEDDQAPVDNAHAATDLIASTPNQTIDQLGALLRAVPENERESIGRKLAALAQAPDSAQLLSAIQASLYIVNSVIVQAVEAKPVSVPRTEAKTGGEVFEGLVVNARRKKADRRSEPRSRGAA